MIVHHTDLQKIGLDSLTFWISNFSVVTKFLERLVVRQLMAYWSHADLLPTLQSSVRPGHSTETVLQVLWFNSIQ